MIGRKQIARLAAVSKTKYCLCSLFSTIQQHWDGSDVKLIRIITESTAPAPKVKHWSYFRRHQILEESNPEPERSMLRKEMAKQRISFEDEAHDIYDPQFSSGR